MLLKYDSKTHYSCSRYGHKIQYTIARERGALLSCVFILKYSPALCCRSSEWGRLLKMTSLCVRCLRPFSDPMDAGHISRILIYNQLQIIFFSLLHDDACQWLSRILWQRNWLFRHFTSMVQLIVLVSLILLVVQFACLQEHS